MRQNLAALVCVAALLGAASCGEWGERATQTASASAAQGTAAARSIGGEAIVEVDQSRARSGPSLGYRWNSLNPGTAISASDAAWLHKYGYADDETERYLRKLSKDQLARTAGKGNRAAQSALLWRQARDGAKGDEIYSSAIGGAAKGSVGALRTAGDIFFTDARLRDPALGYAFNSVAARMGDHSALAINYVWSDGLKRDEVFRGNALAEIIWEDVLRRGGGRNIQYRPGFEEYKKRLLVVSVDRSEINQ